MIAIRNISNTFYQTKEPFRGMNIYFIHYNGNTCTACCMAMCCCMPMYMYMYMYMAGKRIVLDRGK